ncbi:MAG: radical SAM protein [Brevinemataceae bacterium]
MSYKYLYGPIPSRRLGVSLGVDPIPFKTCPLNCIYCECGATNNFTLDRQEFISTNEIIAELDDFMKNHPAPDFITFSGSGEPTLHSGLGRILAHLKTTYPQVQTAVLTNSIMLSNESLQEELLAVDLVAPSLDAVSERAFEMIDKPMPGIDIAKCIVSLKEFAQKFLSLPQKKLWIEIFVVEGINDTDEEINQFVEVLQDIPYSLIQLNRLDRIGTNPHVKPASMERLHYIKSKFVEAGLSNVEIIGKFKKRNEILNYNISLEELILTDLSRRSLSLEDMVLMTNGSLEEISQYLDVLSSENKLSAKIIDNKVCYQIKRNIID